MKPLLLTGLCLAMLFFSSCQNDAHKTRSASYEAKGGVYAGGILHVNETEDLGSLMPIAINEVNGYHIASQVYEGLVKYNQSDLSLQPALARSWEINSDNTEYTFHLRTGVYFQNDSCFDGSVGRLLKASDVKYCFEHLCTPNVHNTQFEITFKDRVEGATEYFDLSGYGKSHDLKGLTVLNDSTIKIKLIEPDVNFLNILTMPGCYIYPREAVRKYGNNMRHKAVGTGPFYIEKIAGKEYLLMKRNPNYWGYDKFGNQLPYLDGIKWLFIKDKKTEILSFKAGLLDMVYRIPVDMFHEIMGDLHTSHQKDIYFDIYTSPALSTHYYGFNLQTNPFFSIKEIRLAFNLAIDRVKIADYTIKGEGMAAQYGMVPHTDWFEKNGYNYKAIKGYDFNPDSAKKLLALAGYPDGNGLPSFNLEVNSGGERNMLVALAVQKMLKENLGVNINISVVPWSEHVKNVENGKSDFFRYSWIADYPDPESFLMLFHGKLVPENYTEKSQINFCRFKNARFDSLFEASHKESDIKKRFALLSMADQIILNEGACIPLFYDENIRLEQKNVRNLPENPMDYLDMTQTYLVPKK